MTGNADMAGQSMLDRFVYALARIVQDERPDLLGQTITVAELYQEIAPYRRMREAASLEMHADYEHALIRFLAGEGGYAQLDPESAADELGIEAESSDPDLSLYRKFAACDLRMAFGEPLPPRPPAPVAAAEPVARPGPQPSLAETMRALAPDGAEAPAIPRAAAKPASEAPKRVPHRPAGAQSAAAGRCGFCGQSLPAGREVRYCPHCGVDLTSRECSSCGEPLEDGWRFCIACGAGAEP